METDKLIQKLAAGAGPVRPLASPWARTALWLAVALPYIALVVAVISPRADLLSKLADARFLIEQIAALATGIAAAMAAFASTVPGYDRKVLLLPAPRSPSGSAVSARAVSAPYGSMVWPVCRCSPTGSACPPSCWSAPCRRWPW